MASTVTTINPATGVVLSVYQTSNAEQIEHSVAAGATAAEAWGRQPLKSGWQPCGGWPMSFGSRKTTSRSWSPPRWASRLVRRPMSWRSRP